MWVLPFMHLISRKALTEFARKHAGTSGPLDDWYRTVKSAQWKHLEEVKQVYPKAEGVGSFTVFNIKGNAYRLIVGMDYEAQVIYVKYILTHAEYDKGGWM